MQRDDDGQRPLIHLAHALVGEFRAVPRTAVMHDIRGQSFRQRQLGHDVHRCGNIRRRGHERPEIPAAVVANRQNEVALHRRVGPPKLRVHAAKEIHRNIVFREGEALGASAARSASPKSSVCMRRRSRPEISRRK